MRILTLCAWLLIPIGIAAFHYGPGQRRMELDRAGDALAAARQHVDQKEFPQAIERFDQALATLPKDCDAEGRKIRLERAKAQLLAGQLGDAYDELATLVPELQEDPKSDPRLLADARAAEANAKYYQTWLMRLEGRPREEWEPEIDGSRQLYRLLAEEARDRSDEKEVQARKEDLESAVRLARMDLSELQALPLPCQCCGNCKGKSKKKCSKCVSKRPGDEMSRQAGSGPPPDEAGN